MARTVHSMLVTTPFFRPRQGTFPAPRMVIPLSSISPTTAETLVEPRSKPTTISEETAPFVITDSRNSESARRCHAGRNGANLSQPHHRPFGVCLVVQEHDPRSTARLGRALHDPHRAVQAGRPRRRPEGERKS